VQYVVSAEDRPYFAWQIELLHHSMRLLGIEKDLVICMAEHDKPRGRYPWGKVVWHDNLGKARTNGHILCMTLNKSHGLLRALWSGVLRQPFVLLDPDMVLLQPIPLLSHALSAQRCGYMEFDDVEKAGYLIEEDLKVSREHWHAAGWVYQFNGVHPCLFLEMHSILEELVEAYDGNKKSLTARTHYWARDMVAYIAAFGRRGIPVRLVDDWQASGEDERGATWHYTYQHPSGWDKRNYQGHDSKVYESILAIPDGSYNIVRFKGIVRNLLEYKARTVQGPSYTFQMPTPSKRRETTGQHDERECDSAGRY
jgi:hypothetical protein